jgi:hypothetical protein
VFWTPFLRALVHPRRGGITTNIRPLPTLDEAWARLRRAVWADDKVGMERKSARSTVWGWVTSLDARARRMGERFLDANARRVSFDDDVMLVKATFGRYGQFPAQFHLEMWEAVADLLTVAEGLPEALRRAYVGLHDELPYSGVGPFQRFRELLVVADRTTFEDAKKAILESYATEAEKAKKSIHRSADLRWTTTFLLPLGPEAGDDERRMHDLATQRVPKFGDFGAHACGLAAGDLVTLDKYLAANGKIRHEFFAGTPKRHIAALLDIEGSKAAAALSKMKLADPFDDSVAENTRWCELLAHFDDDAALDALYAERQGKVSKTWGIGGLLTASRFNFDRVMSLAKRHDDGELIALLEGERGKAPDAPLVEVEDSTVAPLAAPSAYVPPPAVRPVMLKNPLGLAPDTSWRDEEREGADFDREATWDGVSLARANAEELEAFVAHCEKWALPVPLNIVAAVPGRAHPRLFALGFDMSAAYWARYCLRPIMVAHGVAALPALIASLQNAEAAPDTTESVLAPAQGVGDVSIAPAMIKAFAGKKYKQAGRAWMLRHPVHAIAGALEVFGRGGDAQNDAARSLRFLDTRGHREKIEEVAQKMGTKDAVTEMLDRDPLAQPKVKKPALPKFAAPKSLPKLVASSGKVDDADVEKLLVELAFSNADEVHPGVLAAKRRFTSASRAAFAWALFEAWLVAKADPKDAWCMQSIGFFGDDECARKLAALAKAWPGENASARAQAALDALLNIGTDTALMNINVLAEKSRFPAFKAAAAERISAIADARGLTTDELADRLAPTLGLDEAGAGDLDYGARKFKVAFDERLQPVVKDASGATLADLPKPAKSDDAALAKEAKARLSGLKKDAKTTASLQIARMERAMTGGRRIERAPFLDAFAGHPWMRHLAQRLVWGVHRGGNDGGGGELTATFRVAEDGTLSDDRDKALVLPKDATVSVVHPARMPEEAMDRWRQLFADYEIVQPFAQLSRPVHAPSSSESGASRIERFRGRKAVYGALRGLESRGWRRVTDDAVYYAKQIGKTAWASLETEPGWHPSQSADEIEPQTLGDVVLHAEKTARFGELDPVVFSEIVYDVDAVTAQ